MALRNSNLPWVSVDIDVKEENVISQKQSVKSYASRVFRESTIGIISSIVTTHSKYRKIFKLFLSLLCITGFLYQCVTFLNHVFEYPTVINMAVDRSDTYSRPAFTFCYNNVIRRSVFCRMYPDLCIEPSEEFRKKFSSYCGANKTLIPMEKYYAVERAMSNGDILKYGGEAGYDRYHSFATNMYKRTSGPYLRNYRGLTGKMICYSLHSVVENNQQPSQRERRQLSFQNPIDVFIFYVNEREMMKPTREPGVLFSVHSPLEFVNPFERGIFFKGGRTYKIFLEMQEEILLKEPFETNCMDYEDAWEKNNRSGPRTQKMCQEKCQLDSDLSRFHCADYTTLYPSKDRICEIKGFQCTGQGGGSDIHIKPPSEFITGIHYQENFANRTFRVLLRAIEWVRECQKSCRQSCRSLKYATEVSVRHEVEFIKDTGGTPHRYIVVEIYLPSDVTNVLSHSPKYMTVEVFSSIGGFMGCWLGIALLDILDVFGSMITVFRYAFGKRL